VASQNLAALTKFDHSYQQASVGLWNSQLTSVVDAFIRNVDRAWSALSFPALLMEVAPRALDIWREATSKVTGNFTAYPQGAESLEKYKHLLAGPTIAILLGPIKDVLERWERGTAWLDTLIEVSGDAFSVPAQAMLSNMVMGIWTAFEVMASDLWETALNIHPHGLAGLQGGDGDSKKQISLVILQKHDYDLRDKMGTVLKEKLGPRGLQDIRRGYRLAFSKNGKTIEDALASQSLDQLSAVRNVLVHQGGKADQDFCDRVAQVEFKHYAGIQPGAPVGLNGEIILEVIDPAIRTSVELIRTVDGWLKTH
jgi:hypothetical protein